MKERLLIVKMRNEISIYRENREMDGQDWIILTRAEIES